MQVQQILISLAVSCAVVCAPSVARKETSVAGEWRASGVTESRTVAESGADTVWVTSGRCGRWESQVSRPGNPRAAHRALFAWTLPSTTAAGDVALLTASVVVLEAAGLEGDSHVEVFAWQGAPDQVPADATRLVSAYVPAGAPDGTIERIEAAWRLPQPGSGSATLQVRCVVTHRGNTLSCTHSYGWSPAPPL